MCAFVWMMITFTLLTFELLNSKSCYVALPVSSLIATSSYSSAPCYWSLLLRQEMPSSCFCKARHRSSNSGWWTSAECSSGTMNLRFPSHPMPPSCGEMVTTYSQALWTTKTLPRRLLGTAGVLASTKRGCVCWLLSCGEGPEPCAGEGCFSGGDSSLLGLESYIPSLNGKPHPGKKCIHEHTVSTFLRKFFSNRETCKP